MLSNMLSVTDVRFEHYHTTTALGVQDSEPRISWKIARDDCCRIQNGYEVELTNYGPSKEAQDVSVVSQQSQEKILTQCPFKEPPDQPWKGATDAKMVSNMFLLQSLDLMSKICGVLGRNNEQLKFNEDYQATRVEFQQEYVTPRGRTTSDSQAAYALAICLNLLDPAQQVRAGDRLVELIRKNGFKVGTGFAATPFLCEALASTGHVQVAYAMLLEKGCPSWLYPVTMGATTVWERWDSMLPDGSINPEEMTSFNHYAFGAIAKFMYERVAGLQRLEPGWRKVRISPAIGATFSRASASHVSPQGTISFEWETSVVDGDQEEFVIKTMVPANTIAEIVLPGLEREEVKEVGSGEWTFTSLFRREYEWPVLPLPPKS